MSGARGTVVVGVDCAIEEERTGIACGRIGEDGTLEITRVTLGTAGESATATIAGFIDRADRYVVALDAPLGWPMGLGPTLTTHRAGERVAAPADHVFRRETERFVHYELGKTPPEVGADRIARTAHAALELLEAVRKRSKKPLPLGERPGAESCAIEVLPQATLLSRGIAASGYKGIAMSSRNARAKILERLEHDHARRAPRRADREPGLARRAAMRARRCRLRGWRSAHPDEPRARCQRGLDLVPRARPKDLVLSRALLDGRGRAERPLGVVLLGAA